MNGFKETLDRHDLTFTLTLNLTENLDYTKFKISKLFEESNFVNVVYDFKRTPKNNSINDASESFKFENVDEKVKELIRSIGIYSSKIVMGILFDGPGFVTTFNGKGPFHQTYAYREFCESRYIYPLDWEGCHNKNGASISIFMENPQSIENQVKYAINNGLAGVAPFYISFDDHYGMCKFEYAASTSFPLLRTINEPIREIRLKEGRRGILTPVITPSPLFRLKIPKN